MDFAILCVGDALFCAGNARPAGKWFVATVWIEYGDGSKYVHNAFGKDELDAALKLLDQLSLCYAYRCPMTLLRASDKQRFTVEDLTKEKG